MKRLSLIWAASVCLAVAAGVAYAAPLTEQQLLDMKAAGIGEKVIVHQIETDGIAFPIDARTMIALRKAGFSDALLNALLSTKDSAKQGTSASSIPAARASTAPALTPLKPPAAPAEPECARLIGEADSIVAICHRMGISKKFFSAAGEALYEFHCLHVNACAVERTFNQLADTSECPGKPVGEHLVESPMRWDDCDDPDNYKPDSDLVYHLVQTLQTTDSKASCAELKVMTSDLEENVAQMDKSLGNLSSKAQALNSQAQTNSSLAQMANAIGGKGAPVDAAALSMLSSSDTQAAGNTQQQAGSLQQIRDSQQKRHDYLMQIYFQKRCDD